MRVRVYVFVCLPVWVSALVSLSVYVCERERECVCVRERERERERVCVCPIVFRMNIAKQLPDTLVCLQVVAHTVEEYEEHAPLIKTCRRRCLEVIVMVKR